MRFSVSVSHYGIAVYFVAWNCGSRNVVIDCSDLLGRAHGINIYEVDDLE
jgi:hypothetical protein